MKAKCTIEALKAAHERYLTDEAATYAVLAAELQTSISALHRRWSYLGLIDDDHRAASGRRPRSRVSTVTLLAAWRRYPATPLVELAAELDLDIHTLRRRWRALQLSPAARLAGWRSTGCLTGDAP
jgi:hypothetical protein